MEYAVHLKVSVQHLTTVLDTIKDCAEVVKIEQVVNKPPVAKTTGYRDGKRNKGISGTDLLLSLLANGPRKLEQLEDGFDERGFARSSVSPTLSRLNNEKKVRYDADTNSYRKV